MKLSSDVGHYRTGGDNKLFLPAARSEVFCQSFVFRGFQDWNCLPNELRTVGLGDSFKKAMTKYERISHSNCYNISYLYCTLFDILIPILSSFIACFQLVAIRHENRMFMTVYQLGNTQLPSFAVAWPTNLQRLLHVCIYCSCIIMYDTIYCARNMCRCTNRQTNAENVKQSYDQPFVCCMRSGW